MQGKPDSGRYFRWTPENIEMLRLKWPTHSATEIGKILGVSRNVIIGKVGRLGLKKERKVDNWLRNTRR